MSTSHEWAKKLRETADVLESRPECEMAGEARVLVSFYGNSNKEAFIAAVRALKPGIKKIDQEYVNFYPSGTILNLYINRDAVCRKVQDVKYECEPLLSPQEDADMEQVATAEPIVTSDIPF